MAKRSDKYKKSDTREVDLLTFMNLLAILIPTLLISTEYIKIAGIAVTTPASGPTTPVTPTDKPPEEKLNLTMTVGDKGIFVLASGKNVSPSGLDAAAAGAAPGATAQGEPTVGKTSVTVWRGTSDGKESEMLRYWEFDGKKYIRGVTFVAEEKMTARIDALRNNIKISNPKQSTEEDYNYPQLNKILADIKARFPEELKVIVMGMPRTEFTHIVRTMDCARYKMDRQSLSPDEKASILSDGENGPKKLKERQAQLLKESELFPQVIISPGLI